MCNLGGLPNNFMKSLDGKAIEYSWSCRFSDACIQQLPVKNDRIHIRANSYYQFISNTYPASWWIIYALMLMIILINLASLLLGLPAYHLYEYFRVHNQRNSMLPMWVGWIPGHMNLNRSYKIFIGILAPAPIYILLSRWCQL